MARTPLTEREKQLLEEGRRNTALREQGKPVPAPAPSVSDPNRAASLDGPVERIGTATRVGDTLYGSATGLTPDNFAKAQSYLNTQSTLDRTIRDPKATLPQMREATAANDAAMESAINAGVTDKSLAALQGQKLIEMAPGVKMGEETAARYATNMQGTADAKAKARADMDSVLKKAQEFRTSIAKDNLPGGKSFEEGREKWQATLKAREDEKNLNDLVKQDMQFAGREAASARRNYYALERAQRGGKVIDPDAMKAAQDRLTRSEMGLGPTNNVDDRRKRFRAVREGEPPARSQGMGLQGQPIDSGNLQSMFDLRLNPYGSNKKRQPIFGSLV